jgi:hypothetical protein
MCKARLHHVQLSSGDVPAELMAAEYGINAPAGFPHKLITERLEIIRKVKVPLNIFIFGRKGVGKVQSCPLFQFRAR